MKNLNVAAAICVASILSVDPLFAQSDPRSNFVGSFVSSIGGCSRLMNNMPAQLRTQRSGTLPLAEVQRADATLMGRLVRDWTENDIAAATSVGIQCFGEKSGLVLGESIKRYVSAFKRYDQQVTAQKDAQKRLERESADRMEREEAERLRQQIEDDRENSRIAAERTERLAPLIAEAQKSAALRKEAEGGLRITERLEQQLKSSTPEYMLSRSYEAYATLLRCVEVRDGYAAVNLSNAEMSSARTAIKSIESALDAQLSTASVGKDQLWKDAAAEVQKRTQNWDSRSQIGDICRQTQKSLLAGEAQLSGGRVLKKDF